MIETLGYKRFHEGREKNDFYATPTGEMTNLTKYEKLEGVILDPCAGIGGLTKELKESGLYERVMETDLEGRGYCEGDLDFLDEEYPYTENIDTIVMNPPFKYITPFLLKALSITNKKVCMFGRIQFLESKDRYEQVFSKIKPSRVYIYVDRISCAKNSDFSKKMSSSMCYAWYVFDKEDTSGETKLNWIRRNDMYDVKQKKKRKKDTLG